MAIIGLQTWGSEGDVQPFLALSRKLVSAGHQVQLAITTQAERRYAQEGVQIERVGPAMTKAEGDALLQRCVKMRSPMSQAKLILERAFAPAEEAMFEAARAMAKRCDLLVRHHFLHMTQAAALERGVPEISVYLAPDLIPTRTHPPTGMPNLGPTLNRALWWMAGKGIQQLFGVPAARLRRSLGLPAP